MADMKPEVLESTQARHQSIRAFVEHEYPGYAVTEIREFARSEYAQREERNPVTKRLRPSGEYILSRIHEEFQVTAANVIDTGHAMHYTLLMDAQGRLRVTDVAHAIGYSPLAT